MKRKAKYSILFLLAAVGVTICSYAQNITYLTTTDGLNNGAVNDIAQDSRGYIWLATWDGITRYDGYTMKDYRPQPNNARSLPARQVLKLFVDSQDNLWATTYNGLSRYNREQDYFERVPLEGLSDTYLLTRINNSLLEYDQTLYLRFGDQMYYHRLTRANGLKTFNKLDIISDQTIANYKISLLNNQLCLIRFYNGRNESVLYQGHLSKSGDKEVLDLEYYHTFQGKVGQTLNLDSASSIIVINNSICRFSDNSIDKQVEVLLENANPDKLLWTSDNKLWMIPKHRGLACLDLHSGNYEFYLYDKKRTNLLLGNQLSSLFEDFSGNLWIGHSGRGVSILNLHQKVFHTFRNIPGDSFSLSSNSVMGFAEYEDGLMIATDYDAVNLMKTNPVTGQQKFERLPFPEHFQNNGKFNSIWGIAKENEQLFWLAGSPGLIRATYRDKQWKLEQIKNTSFGGKLRKIMLDKSNNIWLGSYAGLYLFPNSQRDSMGYFQFLPDPENDLSISDNNIIDFLIDSKNRFWIATRDHGINLLNTSYANLNLSSRTPPELNFRKFETDTTGNSLNSNEINCLFEYFDGTIWAGTQGGGINIIDPESGKIEYITSEDGLPGENIFGMLLDEQGKLWISTNKGICSIATFGKERRITNYNPSDGIQGNVFMVHSYYKGSENNLYFGGRNGFTYFNPSDIHQNEIPPKIIFTDLRLFDQEVEINQNVNQHTILSKALNETDSLVFSHKDYNIRIGVAAVHFQDPGENRIFYKLEGFDKEWNQLPSGEKYINYSNLDAGKYRLLIGASNSDNIMATEERVLHLQVTPPWYKTWYGYMLFFTLLMAAAFLLFRLILREQVLRHKVKLDEKQIENMKQLNEIKLKFFTNISHDLRTPLSLVLAPIEYVFKNKEVSPVVREQLSMSLRNAKTLKRLIGNIINFRKIDAGKINLTFQRGDIAEFIRTIGRNFEILQSRQNIKLIYHLPENQTMADFDPEKLEQVMYNLLSNAFKHTPKEGTILLTMGIDTERNNENKIIEDQVFISVFNEGDNISNEHLNRIFDRFYQVSEKGEGSGIGLSVAQSLVQLHKGQLEVRNIESSGVEFLITLPRFTSNVVVPAEFVTPSETVEEYDLRNNATIYSKARDEGVVAPKDFKIVVIEDNSELRSFYKTLLSGEYEFFEAENGLEGIEVVEKVLPDIVISDVVMPKKNGYEVCQHLKEQVLTSHIPVILLTARGAPDQIVLGYRSGADAYVTKPFENEVLLSQIKCIIENRELLRKKYNSVEYVSDAMEDKPKSRNDLFIDLLNQDIEENLYNEDYNVASLSQRLNISRNHLYRKVKALTGYSTVEYIRIRKLNKAAELLKTQQYSIKEVCYKTGFRDQSYFTKSFRSHFDLSPTQYIRTYSKAQ